MSGLGTVNIQRHRHIGFGYQKRKQPHNRRGLGARTSKNRQARRCCQPQPANFFQKRTGTSHVGVFSGNFKHRLACARGLACRPELAVITQHLDAGFFKIGHIVLAQQAARAGKGGFGKGARFVGGVQPNKTHHCAGAKPVKICGAYLIAVSGREAFGIGNFNNVIIELTNSDI